MGKLDQKVLCFLVLLSAAYGWAGFDTSPSLETSFGLPDNKNRVPRLVYHIKSQSVHAPSPIMLPKGSVSQPPILSPKLEDLPPATQAVIPSIKPPSPPEHASLEPVWSRTLSPSVESQAPNVAVGTTHDLPPIASPGEKMPIGRIHGKAPVGDESPFPLPHVPGPAISPAGIASPIIHRKNYGMPVAAPPKEISSSSSLVNNSHAKGCSPVMSPAPHEVQQSSNVTCSPSASQHIPAWSPRVESPAPHEVEHSNISPAPSGSHPNPLGASPAISPVPHEVKSPSKTTHAPSPSPSLPEPLKISPMISPVPHEVNRPSPITHAPLASQPPLEESSPMLSPTPHEVRKHSNVTHTPVSSQSPSSGISPTTSPAPHEVEKPSNITHAPLSSHPHPAGSSPGISPMPDEAGKPSNVTHAPLSSHPHPSETSPVISPRPHKEEPPSNSTHAPLASHSHGSGSSPVLSPLPHEGKNPSNDTLAPLPAHPHVPASSPTVSPLPHEVKKPSNITHAPLASHPHPPTARVIQSPAIAPTVSPPLSARKRVGNVASAPSPSFPPSSYHPGTVISPSPQPATERPNSRQNHHTPLPHIRGLSPSPSQSNTHPPVVSPIIKGGHRATPPYTQAPSLSPIVPFPSTDTEVAPAPSKSSTGPSRHNKGPVYAPIVSPSGSFSRKPRAPSPPPLWAFPPPPPNLDCNTLSCSEPWTNPLPGTPCVCVLPIKVGLRLSVALYTFFPLVSELAQEIASGIFMKQSQVRIMGANAASEDPEKTVVLIDLVPFGKSFDRTTPFITYDKFWHKQVAIKASYFGDYDVLYVTYPGLPASPPAPADINVNDGAYGNNNNARTVRPLGVDVRKRRENLSGSLIATIVLSSVIALVLSVGAAWFLLFKRRDHNRLSASTSQSLLPQFLKASGTGPTISGSGPSSASPSFSSSMAPYTGSAKSFTLAEIERATGRLDDSRIIGEGGFGRVYQGTLEDGTRVAVKVLKRDDQQGGREFLAEVEMLSRLHHRNLVKLIGICTEEHIRCLVYELIPNGSVESHLHGVDKEISPLDWNARMKIALGAARGLAYLHEDSSPRVIHRDFKSSNILLEHDYTPKVSDFGLARTALEEGNEHISTRVMGTFGYVAPEYAMTGHLLVKSDVYSYGVVLLELLTGRKPVDMSQPPGQENLVNWARPLLTSMDGLETIIDPSLGTEIPFDSVAKVAAIASMCVQPEVSHRPFMGEVVQALKLVCSENEELKRSESCSQDESSTKDEDARIRGFDLAEERVLPESDVFYTSARFTRDASGSFRRHSSSGPLRTGRSHQFWQRLRGFSSGSMSDHGALRLGAGLESGGQWP